jgi:hypothetical protein
MNDEERQVFFFANRRRPLPCFQIVWMAVSWRGRNRNEKRKVPVQPCGQTGTNRGLGVRHTLFPMPTLGAPSRGCRLPDAILHGKRSFRPRSRAVQRLSAAEFQVRLFSSLGLVVAPPAREPDQDTFAIFPRLDLLAPGQPPLLAVR